MKQKKRQTNQQPTPQTAPSRLCRHGLKSENRQYRGTGGISQENRGSGFIPAFHDQHSGRSEISCYADGSPAPVHVLDGLPKDWIAEYDTDGHALSAREGVIAGFLRNGIFYTREEAACAA